MFNVYLERKGTFARNSSILNKPPDTYLVLDLRCLEEFFITIITMMLSVSPLLVVVSDSTGSLRSLFSVQKKASFELCSKTIRN